MSARDDFQVGQISTGETGTESRKNKDVCVRVSVCVCVCVCTS